MRATEATAAARRSMEICNACRYCETYCAVFPAMTLRRDFSDADLGYLANLCHGCRGCFYACQYAPPHEFGINLPQQFAEVRAETYEEYAWPASLGRLFHRNGVIVSTAAALSVALVLILTMTLQSPEILFAAQPVVPGTFYRVIPFGLMAALGTITFLFSLVAIFMGARNFWLDAGGPDASNIPSWSEAISDALTLKNLGGGGDGCNDVGERFSQARRHLHHTLFYGFALCFLATTLGFFYHHFFGWVAPYGFFRAPVLLGTLGGIGMMVGSVGLFWLKVIGDREPTAPKLLGGEVALLFLLFAVALTGMLLLAFRATGAMGILLAVHLGFVLAFFLSLPYSRMVHGPYRLAALLRCAIDRRTREPVG
jgi:citrate/tricarballylate utilization protein